MGRSKSAAVTKRIREAIDVLQELGFPRAQVNERSALTLLSLLDLKPHESWSDARAPLMGITPMMDFFATHYGKKYAPNTRETVRRHTIHQFVQAGLVVPNPDKPSRPTNSPKAVYQIEPSALQLLQAFGTFGWPGRLSEYLASVGTLRRLYARDRQALRIPVTLRDGTNIRLSPGSHNILVKRILDEFCPVFTPGGQVIYVGDTQRKWAYSDSDSLEALGVRVEEHGKMPDLVVHDRSRNWLVLIEAVTSHGPVNPKRRQELAELFAASKAGIVYVTAFLDRRTMVRYLEEISWETEVWIAESPTHLIHFNGERFLGPYD
jgi:hypothetical protein